MFVSRSSDEMKMWKMEDRIEEEDEIEDEDEDEESDLLTRFDVCRTGECSRTTAVQLEVRIVYVVGRIRQRILSISRSRTSIDSRSSSSSAHLQLFAFSHRERPDLDLLAILMRVVRRTCIR